MKQISLVIVKAFELTILLSFILVSFAFAGGVSRPEDRENLERAVSAWNAANRAMVSTMVDKYGYPNEATLTRVTWFNNGIWKRTTVYKEEVLHMFPRKHFDILEQAIEFRVPPEAISSLSEFNGSIMVDRTKGELIARGDRELTNIITLNLSVDIMEGVKSVKQARDSLAMAYEWVVQGKMPDEFSNLRFRTTETRTADPDVSLQQLSMNRYIR